MRGSSVEMPPTRVSAHLSGALFLLLLAFPAVADFKAVPGREYREFHNVVNPVRGEAVVGLAVAPTEAAQRSAIVQVFFRKPYSGEVLVETTTADGRFRGEGVYTGSTKGNEWIRLPIAPPGVSGGKDPPSRPVGSTFLSIAARGPGGAVHLVRWGDDSPVAPEQIRLYVNSRRADMFVRAGSQAGAKVVRCERLKIPVPVRFDSYCDVTMSDLPRDGRLTLIRRDQFEEQSQTLDVSIP